MHGETSFGMGRARAVKNLLLETPYTPGLTTYTPKPHSYTPKPHSATILRRHTLLAARLISRASVVQNIIHGPDQWHISSAHVQLVRGT